VNTTLTNLNRVNSLGEGAAQTIAKALCVNDTLTDLDLGGNRLGEG